MKTAEELRLEIAKLVQEFSDLKYTNKIFKPGRSAVPPSGKVMVRLNCNIWLMHL